ncbi:MAG: sulfatase [Patescibacteria group bacterium]
MTRRLFAIVFILLAASSIWYLYSGTAKKYDYRIDLTKLGKITNNLELPSKPEVKNNNKKIILISLDTVKASSLSVYGYNRNTSEKIRDFSKDALVFKDAYTPIPETLPAHISVFTGLYPEKTGYNSNVRPDNIRQFKTISRIFRENGYATAGVYSSTVFSQDINLDLGFDYVDPPLDYAWQDRAEISAIETNEKVFKWLDDNYGKDFFLWVHYYEAHNPYTAYCAPGIYSQDLAPSHKEYEDGGIAIADRSKWQSVTQQDYRYLSAKYDEEIYCLDKEVDNLFSKLKNLGIYDDATIIIFGDHGESFDHQALFHGFQLYQSEVRVPLIIKSPIINDVGENNVSLLDILPTLADYFNLKGDINGLDGISLNQLKRHKNRVLYLETVEKRRGAVYGGYKIISGKDGLEIYDLKKDKKELNNLVKTFPVDQIKKFTDLLNTPLK